MPNYVVLSARNLGNHFESHHLKCIFRIILPLDLFLNSHLACGIFAHVMASHPACASARRHR